MSKVQVLKGVKFTHKDVYLLSEMREDLQVANSEGNPNREEALQYTWGAIAAHFVRRFLEEGGRLGQGFPSWFKSRNTEWRSLCWNNPYDLLEDGSKLFFLPAELYASVVCHLTTISQHDMKDTDYYEKFTKLGYKVDRAIGEEMWELLEDWGVVEVEDNQLVYTAPEDVMPGIVPLTERKEGL